MPYKNIVFIKLFLRLFEEDDRFLYQLNESQQLLFIKMLYMAGISNNRITKNIHFIKSKVNYHHEDDCFLSDLERIKKVFPKGFQEGSSYYYFTNFNKLHNYIGNSQRTPKELPRTIPDKSKSRVRVDKEKKGAYAPDPKTKEEVSKLIQQTLKNKVI